MTRWEARGLEGDDAGMTEVEGAPEAGGSKGQHGKEEVSGLVSSRVNVLFSVRLPLGGPKLPGGGRLGVVLEHCGDDSRVGALFESYGPSRSSAEGRGEGIKLPGGGRLGVVLEHCGENPSVGALFEAFGPSRSSGVGGGGGTKLPGEGRLGEFELMGSHGENPSIGALFETRNKPTFAGYGRIAASGGTKLPGEGRLGEFIMGRHGPDSSIGQDYRSFKALLIPPPFMHDQPRPHAEDPQISTRSPQESGLLEEQLRRHGRLEAPIIAPPFMLYQPRPALEEFDISNLKADHPSSHLLRRHEQLGDPIIISAPPAMHDHPRPLLEESDMSRQKAGHLSFHLLRRHGLLGVGDPIIISAPPAMHDQPRPPLELPPQVSDQNDRHGQLQDDTSMLSSFEASQMPPQVLHENAGQGQLQGDTSMLPLGYAPPHFPMQPRETVALPSRSKGPSDVPALERAAAELLGEQQRQQRQQVALERWIAQALSASASEPEYLRILEAPVSLSASATEKIMAFVPGFGDVNSAQQHLVQQQQAATTSWVAHAELAGLALPPDLIRESAHAARFAQWQMQIKERAPGAFCWHAASKVCHKGEVGHGLTVGEPEPEPFEKPPRPLFSHITTPGGCCTSAAPGTSCPPNAAPGVCHTKERGDALTQQEPPATWTPLVGSLSQASPVKAPQLSAFEALQVPPEDWRPRIRARPDGQAVGLGCIQPKSMKERCRRDRIR
ncbi:unnamed protein product [Closterium sp. Yama58-4]|nr:unnamed protein product [Closterium sp. Yama58-4]